MSGILDIERERIAALLDERAAVCLLAERTSGTDHVAQAEWRGAQIEIARLARELREGTIAEGNERMRDVYA